MMLDGNHFLIETTEYPTEVGDGNLNLVDGWAPGIVPPIFEASLKTGDYFDSKYVFRFPEFILFSDNSYVHFGPTTVKNSLYPLLRNIMLMEESFLNTVDLDVGYPKAGYVFEPVAWPPVLLDISEIYAIKGGPTSKINTFYEDRYGVPAEPLLVGSSYDDGTGQIYDSNGLVIGYTRDHLSIAYDPNNTVSYLYDMIGDTIDESYEVIDNMITLQGHTEAKLKGVIFFWGSYYWCVLSYILDNVYYIESKTIIEDIESINNKDLFSSTTFNKQKTT